jgi:hypothetical protein|nr:MAG TPA: hypothetical protein [Caudoviricetes sp.]
MRKNKNILVVVPRERIKNYVSTVIKAELRDLKPVILYAKKNDGSRMDFICCCGWRIRIVTEDEMRNLTHAYAYSWNWRPLSREHQRPRIIHQLDKLEQLRAVVEGRLV